MVSFCFILSRTWNRPAVSCGSKPARKRDRQHWLAALKGNQVRTFLSSLFLLLLVTGSLDRTAVPASQTGQPAFARPRFPSPQRDALLNGLQIAVVHRPASRAVAINLTFSGGATYDLAGKAGLASLTAEMLLKGGTEGLAPQQITQIIENYAPDFQVSAGWDSISISATTQPEHADVVIDLIGRLVAGPKFEVAELEAEKKARIQKLRATLNDPAREAAETFDAALYGGYPYGHTIEGSPATIGNIGKADIYSYYKRFFIANNATLVTVGNLSFDDAISAARAGLGRLLMGTPVPATFKPPRERSATSIVVLDRLTPGDSYLHLGGFGISRTHPDYFAALVLNRLLGDGSQSRLVQRISTEKNYTQLISSRFEIRALGGPFVVNAVAPAAVVSKIVEETFAAMNKLATELVPEKELETAKRRIIDEYPLQFETDAEIAARLAEIEVYGLGRGSIVAFQDRVAQVTAEQVRRIAQQLLVPPKILMVVAGPAAELKPALSKFGTFAAEPAPASSTAPPARTQDR